MTCQNCSDKTWKARLCAACYHFHRRYGFPRPLVLLHKGRLDRRWRERLKEDLATS